MKEHAFLGVGAVHVGRGVEGAGRCLLGRGWVLSEGVLSGGGGGAIRNRK